MLYFSKRISCHHIFYFFFGVYVKGPLVCNLFLLCFLKTGVSAIILIENIPEQNVYFLNNSNLKFQKGSAKYRFFYLGIPETLRGLPHSSTDNIEVKCLKFCGMYRGRAPLYTTKFQTSSFNIVSVRSSESSASIRESPLPKLYLASLFNF